MKSLKIFTLLFGFLLISCNESKPEEITTSDDFSSAMNTEREELQELLKNLYKWHELISSNKDFTPILANKSDSSYLGLDMDAHIQRVEELSKTGYFSQKFLDNYDKTGRTIDKKLIERTLVWNVGELPPFSNGTNPWCNCQDIVTDYWDILTIKNLDIKDSIATFQWTWGGDFSYQVKAIKHNDRWEVLNLEGFDFNRFIK
jgi:hypothetical protein